MGTDVELPECSIDINYSNTKPVWGDLLSLCGLTSPSWPVSIPAFGRLARLQVIQADDYFGVRVLGSGAVVIWILPVVDEEVVDHHPGPFDALRIEYDLGYHSASRAAHFSRLVAALAESSERCVARWTGTQAELPTPIDTGALSRHVENLAEATEP